VDIENVTITGNGGHGIYFHSGKGFTLRDSTITGNHGGITYYGYATGDAVVEDNVITNNIGHGVAISLVEGKSATVRNNIIDNNAGSSSDGIYVYTQGTGGLMTIENNPVTKSGRYGIYLTGVRTGSTIANFTVTDSGSAGLYAVASDVDIENVTITGNGGYGIYFHSGKAFTLRDSTIERNGGGITYNGYATGDAVVEDNTITNNIGHGVAIALTEGKSATVRNNKIDNNAGSSSDGIYVYIPGPGGVASIKNNLVEDSGRYGIYLTGAPKSTVIENTISINCYGMRLYSSSNNSIFHNNFIDNINYNAQDNRDSNSWDDGYPSGGNYWHDYPGTDDDGDGIGDESYDISGGAGAQDRYPLMQPWDSIPPTLTITFPAPNTTIHSPTITVAGTAFDASGIASVTVNGMPATGTTIWSAEVTLTEGKNTITVVAIDGAGLNTTKMITVWLEPPLGDLNGDYALTTADAAIALRIAASGEYDPAADVNGDGKVTSLDALMILQASTEAITF
jgi:parallel beta-helix repeat protein